MFGRLLKATPRHAFSTKVVWLSEPKALQSSPRLDRLVAMENRLDRVLSSVQHQESVARVVRLSSCVNNALDVELRLMRHRALDTQFTQIADELEHTIDEIIKLDAKREDTHMAKLDLPITYRADRTSLLESKLEE